MSDRHEEQIISSASEPVVEIIEEVQEDGSIIRKKKTTRKITKRVLTTTTSVKEETDSQQQHNHNHATAASASESSESTLKDLSVGSAAESSAAGLSTTITATAASTIATATATDTAISSTTETTAVSSSETTESDEMSEKSSTTTTTDQTKRTFKFGGVFGKGDVENHPFYRFLAKFPLKQSPAPHTRLPPVKPILYAFAPGWKVGGQETEKQDKKDKETIIGSFDVDSLKWMAYLKFNQIDYDIKPAFEPTMSPSGKLPFLALPNGSLVTDEGFEQWVQENKDQSDTSASLNIHEAAEAVAFSTLAESKIHAALLYTLWLETPHFQGTTRQHYFGHHNYYLGKLLNYVSKSNIVHSMLLTRTQIDRELIFEEAAAAIEALSVQLGENEYFFGKSAPSSLDAIVFSYLHVILTLPRIRNAEDGGRSGELARMVRKHENLFKYSQNIWKKSFAA
ncbi:hypothetical protein BG015_001116 [Linnemannia schmuckeri]|uniref:Uncharacterized protein n=1 Tax=Linnemannia schmuckeri TaxID=64567 RepID=A0A9P5S731_9FUNG|nr:hypothetical protein BG015_001116 [Linnemannia schmuckeri]